MKKTITAALLALCLGLVPLSAGGAEPMYDTVVTVTGSTAEALQAAMDGLPADAGDVRIDIPGTLYSPVDEVELSVPTHKGVTSLTLSNPGTGTVCVYNHGYDKNTLRFFANGVPLIIDSGVHLGALPTTYPYGQTQLFGGSKNADLTGDTSITVNPGGAANAAIYGGGLNGRVDGDAAITVRGAYGTIYGGGLAQASADSGDLSADVTGKVTISVDSEVAPEYEAYRTHTWYNSHIYGGGQISTGFSAFTGPHTFSAQVGGGVSIYVNSLMNGADVFGGGSAFSQCSGAEVALNADVTGDVDVRVGPRTQLIEDCVAPRRPFSVVGGGHAQTQNSGCSDRVSAQVWGNVTVTAVESDAAAEGRGGINSIIGGGVTEASGANSCATVHGDVTVTTSRKTLPFRGVGGVYNNMGVVGGGYSSGGVANVTGNVGVRICKAPGQSADYANLRSVIGGGVTNGAGTANVDGDVTITVDDGVGLDGAPVLDADDGTPISWMTWMGVTGGGRARTADGVANVAGAVRITVGANATFSGTYRLTGGGWAEGDNATANVAGPVTVDIGEGASFDGEYKLIGGGWAAGIGATAKAEQSVTTAIGANASFGGTYSLSGGGWVTRDSGVADVAGAVTTTVGENASFDGDYKLLGGGGITGCWYGSAQVGGSVTTTLGANGTFAGSCKLLGGGWGGDYANDASVTGDVTTAVGDGAVFSGAYRVAGGGWAGGDSYGGTANVGGNVSTRVGKNAGFAGGYLPGRDGEADAKVGIVGGGWVTRSYGSANVTGTVTTLIGENAAFQSPCRVVGGGASDNGLSGVATTGAVALTLDGTAPGSDLEELFPASLEGRNPSAPAALTLKDSAVSYVYDKDASCPEPITVNVLGQCQVGWAFFQGYGYGAADNAKAYGLNIGDGATPTVLTVNGYLTYSYAMPWERLDVHIFDGATLQSGSGGYLFYYYPQSLTLDEGGTVALYADEGVNGALTGNGGALELMGQDARLRVTAADGMLTGTVPVRTADPAAGRVVATTVRTGAQGRFVYDGDGFYIQRRISADDAANYDWYLAALTPPTAATDLVYTGEPQQLLTAAGSAQDAAVVYSLDGGTYSADLPAATAAGTYTVYYKVRGGADGVDTDPRSLEVAIAKAGNAVTGLACPDVPYGRTPSPTATAAFGEVAYTYSASPDGPFGDWDAANACGAWYVRAAVAGTDNYEGAEAVAAFQVTALPQSAPEIAIDFAAETLTGFDPGGRYTVDGGAVTPDETGALPAGDYLGRSLTVVKLGDGVTTADSAPQTLAVPGRPGVPGGVAAADETVLGKGDGKVTGLTHDMEYSATGQAPWTVCPDGELSLAAGETVWVRVRATEGAFAGETLPLEGTAGRPLTVTFDTGEDGAPAAVELAYNATLTAPEEPRREGYAFGGWFRDQGCTQPWDFENDRVIDDVTLYARWTRLHEHVWAQTWASDPDAHWHPCTASGCDLAEPIQMDGYGPHSPDPGTVTTHPTLQAPGERTFRCAVCDRTLGAEPIPQLVQAESLVVVAPDVRGITVDQPRLDAVAEAERPAGSNVTVTLTVCLANDSQHQEAIDAIAALAGEQTVEYADLTLTKETVDANGQTETTPITDTGGRVLEIAVDLDFEGKRDVTVYRYHDGGAEALAQVDTGADGTFRLEPAEGKVYIYASKFSVYAIGYTLVSDVQTGPGGAAYCSILASATEGGTISPAGRTRVRRGRDVTVTITPDPGYVIADVLVDRKSVGAVGAYTFENMTTGHSIQAVFTKQTACPRDGTCPIRPFADADPAAWYHDGVHFCLDEGLMEGYGRGLFGPGDALTRSQLAQILYNQAGRPDASANAPFDDVSADAWYAPAVAWAAEAGVVEGYGDGRFGPDDPITREQLAAMLHRRAHSRGEMLTGALAADFPDRDAVSPWAREAMGAMTANGIIRGKEGKRLDPQGSATRAEAATMLQRFCALTDS